jgi:hypothetical protein
MSQFPRSRFAPLRRKSFYRDFSLFVRNTLVIGLAALLFLAPLSFTVSAQQSANGSQPTSSSKIPEGDYFIVYQAANGDTACREATLAERIEMDKIKPGNLHQINHLKSASDFSAHSDNVQGGENDTLPAHLTINLRATAQLEQPENAPAKAAFIRAAQNWEAVVKSPVTIYLDVDYGTTNFGAPWGSGVLGSTSTRGGKTFSYQTVHDSLIAGASNAAETTMYNSLPPSAVPTDMGDASSVGVPGAIARALGLLDPTALPTDSASKIGFNSNLGPYDFDPSDGIESGSTDFEAVATHEIGHAIGFTSNSGTGSPTPAIWDLFRFRTGTTASSFTTAPRIMTIGGPAADPLQYYFIPGITEVGLSTGGPSAVTDNNGDGNQSSHWKNARQNGGDIVGYIGIMDPRIPRSIRRQITVNDTTALNSFGYNLDNNNAPPPPPPPPAPPANDNFASAQTISGCTGTITGTNVGATQQSGEPIHDPGGALGAGSVWYQWQAPSSGNVTVTTAGSNFDTLLAVYTGTSVGGLTVALTPNNTAARNDDIPDVAGVHDTTSGVTFVATAGTLYKIAVDGYPQDNATGNIVLNWSAANCAQTTPLVQLSQSTNSVVEDAGHVIITVTRTDSTGAATVNYATSDPAGLTNCNVINGIASSRCDYATSVGTLHFATGETSKTISIPVIDDNFSEGNESFTLTLSNPTGATLGSISSSTITITDNASTAGNPIDNVPFFVRQNYIDFLGREPDSFGQGWQAMLNGCASGDITCDRIEVSSRFFRSAEFQERGYFVYRFYSASFGRKPNYEEFIPDVAKVSGFLTEAEKEANKVAFVDEFMQRAEFKNRYDSQTTPTAYVNALIASSGLASHPSHDGWIAGLTNGSLTRAQVLRQLAESAELSQKYSTEAFVVMQYFGYLRRNPDSFYLQWIAIMNQDPANYRNMVNGFMNSAEYRARFAP